MTQHRPSPRNIIDPDTQDNDFGYVMDAASIFVEFLSAWARPVTELKGLKILDYGCGTGRVTRLLALTGAEVHGFDPSDRCITQGLVVEGSKVNPDMAKPRSLTSEFHNVGKNFHIILCVNVLDQLGAGEVDQVIENIFGCLREGGSCYIWVSDSSQQKLVAGAKQRNRGAVLIHGVKAHGKLNFTAVE